MLTILLFSCQSPDKIIFTPAEEDTATENLWPRDPMYDALAETLSQEFYELGSQRSAFALFSMDEILYAEGFGVEPNGREIVPETLFRIGSVTKMLSAIALLQEMDTNGISTEDTLVSQVPSFQIQENPEFSTQISFRDLLQHSSGIVDSITISASEGDEALSAFVNDEMAENYYFMNPPGIFHNYSNPGYVLVGYGAESISGRYYMEKMKSDVFEPLGMNRSFFLSDDVIEDGNYATGLSDGSNGFFQGQLLPPEEYDNGWARPAGFLWSNVVDMANVGMFFLNGDESVLSDSLREEMLAPQISNNILGEHSHYGYGWGNESGFWRNNTFIEGTYNHHSGAVPGYSTTLLIWPEKGMGMVAMAAVDGAYISDALYEALELYDLPQSGGPMPSDIYYDSGDNDDYTGTFFDPNNIGEVIITNENGTLTVEATTLDEYDIPYGTTMSPYTKDNLIWEVQDYPFIMSMIRDDNGQPQYFANRYFVATRQAEEDNTKERRVTNKPIIQKPQKTPRHLRPF
jgi:CubicO group peptidase (beta-lactamase class C family)